MLPLPHEGKDKAPLADLKRMERRAQRFGAKGFGQEGRTRHKTRGKHSQGCSKSGIGQHSHDPSGAPFVWALQGESTHCPRAAISKRVLKGPMCVYQRLMAILATYIRVRRLR